MTLQDGQSHLVLVYRQNEMTDSVTSRICSVSLTTVANFITNNYNSASEAGALAWVDVTDRGAAFDPAVCNYSLFN